MATIDYLAVQKFLKRNKLMVLSTITTGLTPQSAVVAYAEDTDLTLFFQTSSHSRKYTNLAHSSKVSVSIGVNELEHITLQYEGVATKITDSDRSDVIKKFINKKSPSNEAYLYKPDITFFKIRPTWIRYSDYESTESPQVNEWSIAT